MIKNITRIKMFSLTDLFCLSKPRPGQWQRAYPLTIAHSTVFRKPYFTHQKKAIYFAKTNLFSHCKPLCVCNMMFSLRKLRHIYDLPNTLFEINEFIRAT